MEEDGIKYSEVDENTLKISFNGDNLKSVNIYAFFDEDGDPFMQFRCWEIESFKNNEAAGLAVCNDLNLQFRWVKFFLDKDKDVIATLDAMLDDNSSGAECVSLMMRIVNIVDDAYPQIAKARWA
jgi:hypothetical protein